MTDNITSAIDDKAITKELITGTKTRTGLKGDDFVVDKLQNDSLSSLQFYNKCWGCDEELQNGTNDIHEATIECFRCGAITEFPNTQKQNCSWHRSLFNRFFSFLNRLRWLVVIFVQGLIMSLIIPGYVIILPALHRSPLAYHLATTFTFLCSFQVCLNYVHCIFSNAGRVKDFHAPALVDASGRVGPGTLRGFRYCSYCKASKSSDAHHCRTCGICVVDSDHHCPFINNCVGRANRRSFFVFLIWVFISVIYCAITCIQLLWRDWREISDIPLQMWEAVTSGSVGEIASTGIIILSNLKLCHIVAFYIIGASSCVGVGVGGLFLMTLSQEVAMQQGEGQGEGREKEQVENKESKMEGESNLITWIKVFDSIMKPVGIWMSILIPAPFVVE
mmetsp:Transcript_5794/g.11073  ORF Transcript_5794/g.11073 Transcript_5794/m.11073 type:complete len:391 (-) Transcript_5794:259-1431(-)